MIVNTCDIHGQSMGLAVDCPTPKCGSNRRLTTHIELRIRGADDISPAYAHRSQRANDGDSILGIVGGTKCTGEEWPYIVAIYKDGSFHCGGVIHDESWIISAAHCFPQPQNHYYEVRAGLLRRESFSPMSQVSVVAHVIVHTSFHIKRRMIAFQYCSSTSMYSPSLDHF